jgi:hypothetical protein
MSWVSGLANGMSYSHTCGYCADHVIVRPEDEDDWERFIGGSTLEGGWLHDDGECFSDHSTRAQVKECERCGAKDIEREKCILTRRLDWEQREPEL